MKYKYLFVFIITSLFSVNLFSQSVDSLISEALKNNPLLKGMKLKINQADLKSRSFGYLPPPTVGLEFSQVPLSEPDPLNNALSQNLSISQMFMLGGKLSAMENAEKQNVPVAETEFRESSLKLITQIREEYYKIWMDEHHLELRDDLSDLLKNLYTSVENSYKIGRSKYSDLLLIQSEIASNKNEALTLQNDLNSEIFIMNQLLGRDLSDTTLIVQHNWNIDSISINENELIDHLLNHNPSIARMKEMIKMNELEQVANKKELYPDLMLQGMLMRMPQGMILTTKTDPMMRMQLGETEYMYSIMASVTLPFMPWSSGKIKYKEEELAAGIESIQSERINMERDMSARLKGILKKIQSRRSQMDLYQQEVIPLYKQTIEAQLKEFSTGQLTINSLLDTYRTLILKEEELAEIKMEHQMLIADIKMMLGKEF